MDPRPLCYDQREPRSGSLARRDGLLLVVERGAEASLGAELRALELGALLGVPEGRKLSSREFLELLKRLREGPFRFVPPARGLVAQRHLVPQPRGLPGHLPPLQFVNPRFRFGGQIPEPGHERLGTHPTTADQLPRARHERRIQTEFGGDLDSR